uniref:Uncharacterized protein n=1 Tax=Anguilla anguilla TaxID=7936 RepID=A0A0E9SY41_ANGAN
MGRTAPTVAQNASSVLQDPHSLQNTYPLTVMKTSPVTCVTAPSPVSSKSELSTARTTLN